MRTSTDTVAARVFAIADTLDRGTGTQFDPAVVVAYDTIGDDTFARLSEGVRSCGGR